MAEIGTLYDRDFVLWTEEQAAALRYAKDSSLPLDWENLAEEIEDLGNSQRDAVRSHILRIIQHLVTLEYSSSVEPRNGWRRTVRLGRLQIEKRLRGNPSLRSELGRLVAQETRDGIEHAILDFEEHGEIDEVEANVLRRARYTGEQVLGDWFPDEPHG
jgi:hypothetical protein